MEKDEMEEFEQSKRVVENTLQYELQSVLDDIYDDPEILKPFLEGKLHIIGGVFESEILDFRFHSQR